MTTSEFDKAVETLLPQEVLTARLLALMISVFPLFMIGVSVFLNPAPHPDATVDMATLKIMSGLTAVMTVAMWGLAPLIARKVSPSGLKLRAPYSEGLATLCGKLRAVRLISLALQEGAALLGAVVCILAAVNGKLFAEPWIPLNALPAVALLLVSVVTLPNPEKLREEILGAAVVE
jgi:hypothetical protein